MSATQREAAPAEGNGRAGGGNAHTLLRLRALADALGSGDGIERVCRELLDRGLAATGATAGVVVVRRDDDHLELVASSGYDERSLEDWRRFPLSAEVPVSSAVTQRRTVVCASVDELFERYPAMKAFGDAPHALAAYPLLEGGAALGAVALRFDTAALDGDAAVGGDGADATTAAAAAVVPALVERVTQLQGALDSRVVIEQAKGILAERHGLPVHDAFELLRHTARSRGEQVRHIAAAVVRGDLSL